MYRIVNKKRITNRFYVMGLFDCMSMHRLLMLIFGVKVGMVASECILWRLFILVIVSSRIGVALVQFVAGCGLHSVFDKAVSEHKGLFVQGSVLV
jgi:hypothetical protein